MAYSLSPPDAAADRDAILELWRKNLPEASHQRFDWLYRGGPGRCWLLRGDDLRPIGSGGMRLRRVRAFQSNELAGQAIDLNVDAGHRLLGPALALGRAVTDCVQTDRLAFVYSLAADGSEAVMKRLGYSPVGTLTRWVRPLRSAYKLREHRLARPWAGAMGPLADLALWLRSAERGYRRQPATTRGLVPEFDGQFDDLWRRARDQFGILGERTAEYLLWRYARYPELPQQTFGLWRGGRLDGYAVYGIDQQHFCEVSDLFAADSADALTALLAEFLAWARRLGAAAVAIRFLGSSKVVSALSRFGFRPRPGGRQFYVYTATGLDPERRAALLNHENWYLTRGDNDTDV